MDAESKIFLNHLTLDKDLQNQIILPNNGN